MDNAIAVVRWISRSDEGAEATEVVMDMRVGAWTVDMSFTDGESMLRALEERLGAPDKKGLLSRTWSFAGTTVVQRRGRVTVSEPFAR